jgi:excisionase family DNA binding protein
MDADYLTTSEVAAYLRIKERTIYDLVARKEIPCSRATGKLLFPRHLVDRWVEAHIELQDPRLVAPPPIVGGSSDPLLEWALRESGSGLASLVEGSSTGLDRLSSGGCVASGLHLGDAEEGGTDNVAAATERAAIFDVVVVHWAWREQGLVVAQGNPLGLRSLQEVAVSKARVIGRQEGAGTSVLLDRLLQRAKLKRSDLNLLPKPALTQTDVALAILDGNADCGLAIGSVAQRFGLNFVPLQKERFDLACRRREMLQPPLQTLFNFARTDTFREKAAGFGSYDVSRTGEVIYNR